MPTHGMIEIVMPACSMPQSVPPRLVSVRDDARISGSVNFESLFIITSAPRYSFHDVMNANSATVMIAGHDGREEDPAQDLHRVGAVDHRRLLQFARHRLEAVAHDVEAERQLDGGVDDGQPDQRVGQPEVGERQEDRRQQRLVRDDQGEQQQDEQQLLERDREAGQAVPGQDRQARA